MAMVTVLCQTCGRKLELNESYVADMLASGELVSGRTLRRVAAGVETNAAGQKMSYDGEHDRYVEGYFDLCKECRRAIPMKPGDETLAQANRIQHKIAQLKEARPDLDFEARVHAAVEAEFNPKYEKNPAFRAYLIEQESYVEAESE